jgi:hypothetical protein
MFLNPADLLYLIAYTTGVSQYVIQGRRQMMTVRTASGVLFTGYMILMQARTGIIACIIGTLGTFIQAVCPDRMLEKTRTHRIIISIVLALAAVLLVARSPADILPLIALVNSRFVEMQSSQQRIRVGLMFSQICWVGYHMSQGLWLLLCGEIVAILINSSAILWHEHQLKKPVPVPVRIS